MTYTILSQNGEGPDPFFGVIYPFNINAHYGPGSDFPAHILLSVDKMCVSFFSMWEFSQYNADVHNFISKWRRSWPDFFWVINPFNFDAHNGPGSIFQPLPSIRWKNVFSFSSLWEFLKTCWRGQFNLKMAKALTRFFWWFILSISTSTVDRGRFSRHFLLSEDKMCFLLQAVRVFSKNANVDNFISKWRRPWPFLWGDLSFQFQCPQWTGVDFPATSFYPCR